MSPAIGQCVQRIDDGRIGVVDHIAKAGKRAPVPFTSDGDVVVEVSLACSIVTAGACFWERWRPVDFAALAADVLRMAIGPEDP